MLIGYRNHVVDFLGQHIAVEKISNETLNSYHPSILVSKDNPIQFFLLRDNWSQFFTGNDEFLKTPVSYDKNKKITGRKFSEYLFIDSYSKDLIKDQLNEDTSGFAMQFFVNGKTTITIYFYDKQNKPHDGVEEVHANPLFKEEPLIYTNLDKLFYKQDLTIFKTFYNLKNAAYQSNKQFSYDFDEFHAESNNMSVEEYQESKKKEYESISNIKSLKDFKDSTIMDVRNFLSNEIEHRIINSYWLTERQENINFEEFKLNAKKPVITTGDKEEYLKIVKEENKKYTASFPYFFPTYKNWSGNFDHDMVAVGFIDDKYNEDNNKGLINVYFSGNDDCSINFIFSKDTFETENDFLNFMMKDDNRFVSEKLIDKLKELSISHYY